MFIERDSSTVLQTGCVALSFLILTLPILPVPLSWNARIIASLVKQSMKPRKQVFLSSPAKLHQF
jgi:hypothetical protein